MSQDGVRLLRVDDARRTVTGPEEDVRGRMVRAENGEALGVVDDLLVDDVAWKVRFLVVRDDGLLGIGKKKTFVPVEAIRRVTAADVSISHRRGEVTAATSIYDPDLRVDARVFFDDIYVRYGYAPFWTVAFTEIDRALVTTP